ncbi:MAG: hypothetical protein IMF01_08610, partial [Proteobacteria bacterium]|nr:hypothetical protein [Pseudomonadota bacterium]
ANWDLSTVKAIPSADVLMILPANAEEEGFVIIKTTEPGYVVIADK